MSNPTIHSPLDGALYFASKGVSVFPVERGGKRPVIATPPGAERQMRFKWLTGATTDPDQIKAWAEQYDQCNYGGHPGSDELDPFAVIDVDVKNGKDGTAAARELLGDAYDTAPTTLSPSGGLHKWTKGHLPSKDGIAPGVDVKAGHGYVLLPGSNIDGNLYRLEHGTPDLSDAPPTPPQVVAAINAAKVKPRTTIAVEINETKAREATIDYLLNRADLDGDTTAVDTAKWCRDYGSTEAETLELMLEHWNDRCSPPWEADELAVKVRNAFKYAKNEHPGSKLVPAAIDVFEPCRTDGRPLGEDFDDAEVAPAPKAEKPAITSQAITAKELRATTVKRPRRWLVENFVPGESTTHTLFTGEGGTGKSLAALQLAYAVQDGTEWLGQKVVNNCPVICVWCEDDRQDMYNRLDNIDAHASQPVPGGTDDIEVRHLFRCGEPDNHLVHADRNKSKLTEGQLWHQLIVELGEMGDGPKLCILDGVGDVFGGEANDQMHVQQFLKTKLNNLAKLTNTTFVLLHHPGKTDGNEFLGSVAWSNGVRNRLLLKYRDGDRPQDGLELIVKKSNWTAPGTTLFAINDDGVLLVEQECTVHAAMEGAVLDAVDDAYHRGMPLARTKRGGRQSLMDQKIPYGTHGQEMTNDQIEETVGRLLRSKPARLEERIRDHNKVGGFYPVGSDWVTR